MSLETLLGWWSGLAFVARPLPLPTLLGTMVILHLCDAFICRVIAVNNGRPPRSWFLIGLVGGVWAVAVLLLLPSRAAPRPDA
ncbi:MAG: hypothetical protein KIT14_16525 [bacterium]|nr:hypothetical protein [bacterium]